MAKRDLMGPQIFSPIAAMRSAISRYKCLRATALADEPPGQLSEIAAQGFTTECRWVGRNAPRIDRLFRAGQVIVVLRTVAS